MAFYTAVDESELLALLERYGIGKLSSCVGVSDGIENTTYILTADARQWILTLFEDLSTDELPFFTRLMTWLHERALPVACPLADTDGQIVQTLSGKPALLFPRLPGQHPRDIASAHCAAIGDFLGRMHAASVNYPEQRDNPRGTEWMEKSADRLRDLLSAEDAALLASQVANAKRLRTLTLPQGLVHGDLFHDNALFENKNLCGVIDFYNACTDILALDLAIVINDWCALADGGLDEVRMQILLAAYNAQRPLTAQENEQWKTVLQLAATRFWLSRLLAEKLPARPDVNHPHKPSAEYRTRLLHHLT
ncbi:MAG TPA: homoserine kinase [Pseudomonadales bacterium]|nr:homoserine kinase [Pseudomonadales bacterium]